MSVAIIGAGSWGTTLAIIASQNTEVTLFTRNELRANEIQQSRVNEKYLPGVEIPNNVRITANHSEVEGSEMVVFAVPSIGFRESVELFSFLDSSTPYLSVTKGLEKNTNLRMSQVILEADKTRQEHRTLVLSGPNLAKEISKGLPAATVISGLDQELCSSAQKLFMTKRFRVYTSSDLIGCEIGGVAKNVIAIAVGIGDGFGFGDNGKATVMTRALAEITRFGTAEGGKPSTFSGLAGIGDLIATCSSKLSRNYSVGYLLGQGKSLAEISESSFDIAEGVLSAQALCSRAKELQVEMPIVSSVADVIQEGSVGIEAVEKLMTRPATKE